MTRPSLPVLIAFCVLAGAAAMPAGADRLAAGPDKTRAAPSLGAATNLAQGVQPQTIGAGIALGMRDFRDGMNWARVESAPGRYDFNGPRRRFPDEIAAQGGQVSLVVNFGNPLYDEGNTPESDAALAAMADYAGALADRFPGLLSIEVGNEFNGVNFVRGPLAKVSPEKRATAYTKMLLTVAQGIRAVDAEKRILGGATHSLPGAWLWQILDEGGGDSLDALAVHPYTTPAEQFVRQMAVLRRHPGMRNLPVEVTEFGTSDRAEAGNHLLRNFCQFALAGVSRAVWFPANARGEKMVPLFTPEGRITPAGEAWRLVQRSMAGRPVRDATSDPFTYGCLFGENVLVLWGDPRAVTVAPMAQVTDALGRALPAPHVLSETAPIIVSTEDGSAVEPLVSLASGSRVADSFDQFAYPSGEESRAMGDGFDRFARLGTREIPLVTLPGQEAPGTPWHPYRGNPDLRPGPPGVGKPRSGTAFRRTRRDCASLHCPRGSDPPARCASPSGAAQHGWRFCFLQPQW